MRNRCSIQQGEKRSLLIRAKSWKIDCSVFFGPPGIKTSRKNHVKQFLQNGVGRGNLVTVTGSMWQLRGLGDCYRFYKVLTGRLPCTLRNSHVHSVIVTLFLEKCFTWLLQDSLREGVTNFWNSQRETDLFHKSIIQHLLCTCISPAVEPDP